MNRVELDALAQQEQEKQQAFRCRLLCCASTPCLSSGGSAVQTALKTALTEHQLAAEVQLVCTGCMGPCSRGPVVTVQTQGQPDVVYEAVTPALAQQIVAQHVQQGAPVTEHMLPADSPFFCQTAQSRARQQRLD